MKNIIHILFLFVGFSQILFAQSEENISECLKVTKISESTYIHTCNHNNGLIFIEDQEAIIVSTPDSDLETQNLIDWVENKAEIMGYVIDRWHPDAMEGLNIVHKNGISSYSNDRTIEIAKEKNLPVPNIGFDEKLELEVGNKKIVCHYLGEAHTTDGIVVWIPKEKTLFAGNGIRNKNGWIGNIADANIMEWSNTAKRIRDNYCNAKIVIPGHGAHGGPELIDYTIELYSFSQIEKCNCTITSDSMVKDSIHGFEFHSDKKEDKSDKLIYAHGKVLITEKGKEIEICSDSIEYTPSKKGLYIANGCIDIKSKDRKVSFYFNQLYANLRDDEVELTLVIKEIQQS